MLIVLSVISFSNFYVLLSVFYDFKKMYCTEQYSQEWILLICIFIHNLGEAISMNSRILRKNKKWSLHYDNVLVHISLLAFMSVWSKTRQPVENLYIAPPTQYKKYVFSQMTKKLVNYKYKISYNKINLNIFVRARLMVQNLCLPEL